MSKLLAGELRIVKQFFLTTFFMIEVNTEWSFLTTLELFQQVSEKQETKINIFCQHDFCCCFILGCSGSFQPVVAPSVKPFQLFSPPPPAPDVVISVFFPPQRKAFQSATFDPNQLLGQLTSPLLLNIALRYVVSSAVRTGRLFFKRLNNSDSTWTARVWADRPGWRVPRPSASDSACQCLTLPRSDSCFSSLICWNHF